MSENNESTDAKPTPHSINNEFGEQLIPSPPREQLEPISSTERLGVMDSLRGFALIGILMMNIEWFNRPTSELGQFDSSLNGVDYAASWFVKIFVEGKFYKLFALLFGMGFAVMLIKAQQAEKPFGSMFVRRMGALFLFGMAHYIFLWDGDILHDYAIGGLILLGWVQLTRTKRLSRFSQPRSFLKFGLSIITLPVILMLLVGNYVGLTKDNVEREEAWSERQEIVALTKIQFEEAKLELVAKKQTDLDNKNNPVTETSSADSIMETSDRSKNTETSETALTKEATDLALTENTKDKTKDPVDAEKAEEEDDEEKDVDAMTREERVKYITDKRVKSKMERFEESQKEIAVVTDSHFMTGAYLRMESTGKAIVQSIFFSLILLFPIFMLGYWLVASGAINNPDKHPHLFKSLAWIGMIVGLGVTTASLHIIQSPITQDTIYIRNASETLFQFSQYIMAAGYLGLMVCLYQSKALKRTLNILAPLGRMALTNYISHSIILCFIFYGYGMGMFGEISRGPQMLIVAAIIFGQIIVSTLWLKYFRFGPLEWLWRCMTYKKLQPMKL